LSFLAFAAVQLSYSFFLDISPRDWVIWCPTFQDRAVVPSSRDESPIKNSPLKEQGMFSKGNIITKENTAHISVDYKSC